MITKDDGIVVMWFCTACTAIKPLKCNRGMNHRH